MEAYPRCEIEVGPHKLVVQLDSAVMLGRRFARQNYGRKGAELKVWLLCHGKMGKQFRVRGDGRYYSFDPCPVCHREKKEEFWYDVIRQKLPPEWWQPM